MHMVMYKTQYLMPQSEAESLTSTLVAMDILKTPWAEKEHFYKAKVKQVS